MLRQDKNTDRVVKGAFSLSLAVLLTKILGVIYKIPLSYILGDEGMGYFNSAYTLYGFFYIISSAGLPKAVTMVITENKVNKSVSYYIYKYLIKLSMVLGIGLFIIFLIFSPIFSKLFGSENTLTSLVFIAPSILFVSLSGVVRGYLNANLNFLPIAIAQVIEGVSKLVIGLALAMLGKRMLLPLKEISALTILGITIGALLSLIFMYTFTKNKTDGHNIGQKLRIDKRNTLKQIVKLATPITLSSALLSLGSVFDIAIISNKLQSFGYTENEAIALYGNYTTLAVPMINLVLSILTPISVALLPRLISAKVQDNMPDFEKKLVLGLYITASLAAPCAAAYYFYPFEILDLLFDAKSASIGAPLLVLLSAAAFLLPVITILNTGLEAIGRIKASLFSMSISVALKIFLSILLVGNSRLGISSVPLSTTVSYAVSLIVSIYFISKEKISIKSTASIFFPFILGFLSFFIPYKLFNYHDGEPDLLKAIILSIISCMIYSLFSFIYFTIAKIKGKFVKNAQLVR